MGVEVSECVVPLSVVLFIRIGDELGSSEGYVQAGQRQISVGEADQLDRTLAVLLHLLWDHLQVRGSGLGRSPVVDTHTQRMECVVCIIHGLHVLSRYTVAKSAYASAWCPPMCEPGWSCGTTLCLRVLLISFSKDTYWGNGNSLDNVLSCDGWKQNSAHLSFINKRLSHYFIRPFIHLSLKLH